MVATKQQLVTSRTKTTKGKNPAVGIVIHETANKNKGAGAKAHANLQSKGNVRSASWHWSVDDKEAIQSFPHDVRCWHSGKTEGNNSYIGIEICVNSDSNYVQACKNAAELVRKLRSEGVGHKLTQHNGFSGKDCPDGIREGRDGVTWQVFCDWVAHGTGTANPPTPAPAPAPASQPEQRLVVDGEWGANTAAWMQRILGTPVDGIISHQWKTVNNQNVYAAQFDKTQKGSTLGRAIQIRLRDIGRYSGKLDGLLGGASIVGLQLAAGTFADGIVDAKSSLVRALQTEINAGSFLGIRG